MSDKYKIADKVNLSRTCFEKPYYITLTAFGWIDVFTRPSHKAVIVDSLKYCQLDKEPVSHALQTRASGEKIGFHSLHIAKTKSGNFAHNSMNYGNFLWGAGMKSLGISGITARIGAHVNSIMTGDGIDTKDDQKSIKLGIEWKKEH